MAKDVGPKRRIEEIALIERGGDARSDQIFADRKPGTLDFETPPLRSAMPRAGSARISRSREGATSEKDAGTGPGGSPAQCRPRALPRRAGQAARRWPGALRAAGHKRYRLGRDVGRLGVERIDRAVARDEEF
jgi:hypothetical protein